MNMLGLLGGAMSSLAGIFGSSFTCDVSFDAEANRKTAPLSKDKKGCLHGATNECHDDRNHLVAKGEKEMLL